MSSRRRSYSPVLAGLIAGIIGDPSNTFGQMFREMIQPEPEPKPAIPIKCPFGYQHEIEAFDTVQRRIAEMSARLYEQGHIFHAEQLMKTGKNVDAVLQKFFEMTGTNESDVDPNFWEKTHYATSMLYPEFRCAKWDGNGPMPPTNAQQATTEHPGEGGDETSTYEEYMRRNHPKHANELFGTNTGRFSASNPPQNREYTDAELQAMSAAELGEIARSGEPGTLNERIKKYAGGFSADTLNRQADTERANNEWRNQQAQDEPVNIGQRLPLDPTG